MPSAHRAHAEWSPSRLIGWANKVGPATGQLVTQILQSRPHPEQGYRPCLGIMRLGRRHGNLRLEAACARALALGSCRYHTVKNSLSAGQERPVDPAGAVENARDTLGVDCGLAEGAFPTHNTLDAADGAHRLHRHFRRTLDQDVKIGSRKPVT